MSASFEEKSVWITLTAMVVVWSGYFVLAWRMLAGGVTTVAAFVPLFIVSAVLLVVVLIVAHVAVAVVSRPDGRDERDRLIAWRAEHNSSWILAVGVLGAIFALALPEGEVWIANGLFMALFLSEVVKHVLQLYYYRRGL